MRKCHCSEARLSVKGRHANFTSEMDDTTASGVVSSVEAPQQDTWVCPLCSKTNSLTSDSDTVGNEKCGCCGRFREPSWLRVDGQGLLLSVGARFQTRSNSSLGVKVGVVVEVDYFKRCVHALVTSSYGGSSTSTTNGGKFRLDKLQLDRRQLQEVIAITPGDEDIDGLFTEIWQHNVCNKCQRIFQISMRHEDTLYCRDRVQATREQLSQLRVEKAQNLKLRDYCRVLTNSAEIKNLEQKLAVMMRDLEVLPRPSCPHCGSTPEIRGNQFGYK